MPTRGGNFLAKYWDLERRLTAMKRLLQFKNVFPFLSQITLSYLYMNWFLQIEKKGDQLYIGPSLGYFIYFNIYTVYDNG
jgi:hypothetical protein